MPSPKDRDWFWPVLYCYVAVNATIMIMMPMFLGGGWLIVFGPMFGWSLMLVAMARADDRRHQRITENFKR
jgi:hypothetical protein